MKYRLLRLLSAAPLAGLLVWMPGAGTVPTAATNNNLTKLQQRLLSGFLSSELAGGDPANAKPSNYFPRGSDSCPVNLSSNIKVNQNCLNITDADLQGRGQAQNETAIAQDPNDPNHIVATFNDYRRGDGNCYGAFSTDGGRTWNDTTIPMGFTRGSAFPSTAGPVARQYWEAGGDTSIAWDSKGNAYFDCQVFNRGFPTSNNPDQSSGIYVFRATQNNGASWNFPGRPAAELLNPGPTLIPLLDKPYLTVDNHTSSPFQDRVYVTWTLFAADGTANIFESHSSDYGETFSAPVLVSGNTALCPNGVVGPNHCDANQDSQPFTGPDGALYVVFNNFNNFVNQTPVCGTPPLPCDNHNQILLAKSSDGGASFGPPTLVSNYYDLPDCAPYQGGQDFGRACMPEKGGSQRSVFRAGNYPSAGVNPLNPSQVVVTFGSYINKDSQESNGCVPTAFDPLTGFNLYTGVKVPGACNNKILISVSNDGGATFTGTTTDPRALPVVNTDPGQALTDQWWQWASFTKNGKLAVSYYDRQYDADETNGFMDMSLSGSGDLVNFVVERVTSSSMPPPTQFPDRQGNSLFFGDYTGMSAVDNAHPLWMDTRDPDLFICPGTAVTGVPPAVCGGTEPSGLAANDQDAFTANLPVPSK